MKKQIRKDPDPCTLGMLYILPIPRVLFLLLSSKAGKTGLGEIKDSNMNRISYDNHALRIIRSYENVLAFVCRACTLGLHCQWSPSGSLLEEIGYY